MESAGKLGADGGADGIGVRQLVCDLAQSAFLGEWLNRQSTTHLPRLITFFPA